MNQKNNLLMQQINPKILTRSVLIGAAVGLAIIFFFLVSVDRPHPEWGSLWMVKPLVVTPLAGAFGGAAFYAINLVIAKGGWTSALAFVLGLIVAFVVLWLGIVLGLNGTLWN